jgi:Arc/MetJ-type ribon-helix-helix transcriptional regulator
MVWVFNPSNTQSNCSLFLNPLSPTTETRSVDRTELIAAEFHRFLLRIGEKRPQATLPRRPDGLVQSGPRGSMVNFRKAVQQLTDERDHARRKVEQLDMVLKILSGLGGPDRRSGGAHREAMVRRSMSAVSRERIAAAQRARWAKWKAARRGK